MTIYAKQLDETTYTLVDDFGSCVHSDGNLAYHPDFFTGKAEGSIYPVYEENNE